VKRGTTPTNTFKTNIDLTGSTVFITYSQAGRVMFEKSGDSLEISSDDGPRQGPDHLHPDLRDGDRDLKNESSPAGSLRSGRALLLMCRLIAKKDLLSLYFIALPADIFEQENNFH